MFACFLELFEPFSLKTTKNAETNIRRFFILSTTKNISNQNHNILCCSKCPLAKKRQKNWEALLYEASPKVVV